MVNRIASLGIPGSNVPYTSGTNENSHSDSPTFKVLVHVLLSK